MFRGELSIEDDRVLEEILNNHKYYYIIDDTINFTCDNQQYMVQVTYMHKPLDRVYYEDPEQNSLIKRCVVVDTGHTKIPIFRNGEIYTHIYFNNTDISHLLYIKNPTAAKLYDLAIDIIDSDTSHNK